jgi:hypothetical protein
MGDGDVWGEIREELAAGYQRRAIYLACKHDDPQAAEYVARRINTTVDAIEAAHAHQMECIEKSKEVLRIVKTYEECDLSWNRDALMWWLGKEMRDDEREWTATKALMSLYGSGWSDLAIIKDRRTDPVMLSYFEDGRCGTRRNLQVATFEARQRVRAHGQRAEEVESE